MQYRLLLLIPLLLLFATARAQRPGGASGRQGFDTEQETARMAQKLDLRSDQIPQIRDIHRRTAEKIQNAHAAGGRSAMRTQMQAIFEAQDAAMRAVLDAGQWTKYETMKKERRRGRP